MTDLTFPSPNNKCPVCNATDITVLLEIFQTPVHCNVLWSTRDEAIHAPKGDIRLSFCQTCGHIFNLDFNPMLMEYAPAYENSLHFSPRFQSYAESLATHLIERYDLHNKDIIEIGCGQGDFLSLMCNLGQNRGVGFDPSYLPESAGEITEQRVTFIQEFYSEHYAHYKADLICCRHVLEHIQYPVDFLTMIRRSVSDRSNTVIFFEVPNVLFTVRDLAIWDIIYEHCSYFCSNSLGYLFHKCGFKVNNISEAFESQFLYIEAVLNEVADHSPPIQRDNLKELTNYIKAFANKYQSTIVIWQGHLKRIEQTGSRAVIWGAGSKGVTFLNTLKTQDQIQYAVDINPRKQGKYIPGTGQKIVSPEFLRDYQPDIVIVMNPIYKDEIHQLAQKLGFTAELMFANQKR
jgi:SAM-dependent methyltransferase